MFGRLTFNDCVSLKILQPRGQSAGTRPLWST